jgi:Ras-related protein Rab-2A
MYDYIFKYVIAGDYSTGKSCIANRFLSNTFKHQNDTTIGVEFGAKIIYVKNKNVKLQIWDTAGQERFRSICTSYFKNNTCMLLVFDLTKRASFLNLKNWLNILRSNSDPNSLICVIGTKSDLRNNYINKEEINNFVNDNNLIYFECSSKNNVNIDKIFFETVEIMLNKINDNIIKQTDFKNLGIRSSLIEENSFKLRNNKEKDSKYFQCCTIS